MPSDEELMLAVGSGDLDAFGKIVLRHQASAWHTAYRFLGDPAEAEDIAQEAFLRILDAAKRYRPSAKFKTYLYRVVTHLCVDYTRKKQPAYLDDVPAAVGATPVPLEVMAAQERDEAITNALNRLPPRQRMAVILRYYEGLSGREMADAMGASEKAVERLLARARAALEHLLAGFLET